MSGNRADRDGDSRDGAPEGRGGRNGPSDTQFLDLELSQVLYSEAERMAKEVALDLIREGIRDRLRERLGARLTEVGRLAADELADDVEANLSIEQSIAARKSTAADLNARLHGALHDKRPGKKKR